MQIKYQNILLRDMRESDIDDDIYWRTEETRWADWDAPWEPIDPDFDPAAYRRSDLERRATTSTTPPTGPAAGGPRR